MQQLGNLAVVCAKRDDVLMQIYGGIVTIHVGQGRTRKSINLGWRDNVKIEHTIHELNFGKYADAGNGELES